MPYVINKFRGGISDENDKGIAGSFKHGYNLDIHGRNDVLTAGSTMATVNETTVTDLIQFFVPASDGSTYAFSDTGKIYSIAGHVDDPVISLKYTNSNGKIRGAAEWKLDTGVNYLFWTTNSSIARKVLPGDDAWGDVTEDHKTTLDPAEWHTMSIGSGQLNITNNEFLATYDYTGAFSPSSLNVRPGNILKTVDERDDYIILGSVRKDNSEKGHIWSWITTATNYIQKKKIPIQGVNALISAELALLQGGDDGEIFMADFQNTVPLTAIPGGGKVNPGGVDVENDLAVFGFYGGTYPGIWSYGRRGKNRSMALNYQYRLAKDMGGSTISTIGAIAVINGITFASWGTTDGSTSDYGIDCVSTTTKANAVFEGLEFDAGAPYGKKKFDTIHVTMSPLASGCSISAKYKLDKQSSWQYAVQGSGTTTFSVTDGVEAIFSLGRPAFIYEGGLELTSSGSSSPEIHSITTYLAGDPPYTYG